MEAVSKDEFLKRQNEFAKRVLAGAVFVYPTDTIYGVGCDARNAEAVATVRALKNRPDTPLSVIAPSKIWIEENCVLLEEAKKWLEKLPGPYTLVLKMKKPCVSDNVSRDTLGVRIPDSWFSEFVSELGVPVVTTSVNKHGERPMTSIEDMEKGIAEGVDFVVYDGPLKGRPSVLIDLTGPDAKIRER